MKSKLIVSFIVIAYNEEKSIGNCIESIQQQIGLPNHELIVVNDGSIDTTAEVVTKYSETDNHIKLFTLNPNKGRGAARRFGVNKAEGQLIAFVDADIILPQNWLNICIKYLDKYDAVGGIALPDGDVSYIYSKYNLLPKKVKHSATVTGSNGLYKREIFDVINYDEQSRDGEDFTINQQLLKSNFKLFTIKSLEVEHRETKTFFQATRWLYQNGIGATRLLKQFGKIRLPDLTYFGFLFTAVLSLVICFYYQIFSFLILIPLYVIFASILHVNQKFYFQNRKTILYCAAITTDTLLLTIYFLGRTKGLFISAVSKTKGVKKMVIIFFDYEGRWGMPVENPYNLKRTTKNIINVLNKYKVKAVFNSCGIIAKKHPDIIKSISDNGHEIAIHGYNHENFSHLNQHEIDKALEKSEILIKKITGIKPVGFRAPYLYDPIFYDEKLYKILRKRGYKWTSNRQVTRIEEKLKFYNLHPLISKILLPFANIPIVFKDILNCRKRSSLRNIFWLYGDRRNFDRNGIIEIPLASTMDNFLFGLPKPNNDSPTIEINNALKTLRSQYDESGSEFNLNFHDWIIGTSNRIIILEEILKYIKSKDNNTIITASQMSH